MKDFREEVNKVRQLAEHLVHFGNQHRESTLELRRRQNMVLKRLDDEVDVYRREHTDHRQRA